MPVRARDPGSRWWISKPGTGARSLAGAGAPVPACLRWSARRLGRPSMASWPPLAIEIRRGLRASGFGMRISSTPRSKLADTASASTPLGSVSERENAPNERSTRWKPSSRSSCSALRSPETVSVPSSSSISMSSSDMPGQVGAQDELVAGLDQVHGRHPAPQRGPGGPRRVEGGVEEPVHLALQRVQLAERLPADNGHRGSSLRNRSTLISWLDYTISVGSYQVFCWSELHRAREAPARTAREVAHLVLGEVAQEAGADDGDVRRARLLDGRRAVSVSTA